MLKDYESRAFIHVYELLDGKMSQSAQHQVISPHQPILVFDILSKKSFQHGDWHNFYPVMYFNGENLEVGYIIDTSKKSLK